MANWQQTYEQLKKRKKEIDKISSPSEIKQIDKSYTSSNNVSSIKDSNGLISPTNKYNTLDVNKVLLEPQRLSVQPTVTNKSDDKKWYQKFFKSSDAFKDGYDVGDITKTILGTASDLENKLAKGVTSLAEAPIDIASYGAYGVLDKFGAKDTAKKVKEFAQRDLSQEIADKYSEKASIITKGYNAVSNAQNKYLEAESLIKEGKTKEAKETLKDLLKSSGESFLGTLVNQQVLDIGAKAGLDLDGIDDPDKLIKDIQNNSVSGDTLDKTAELIGYVISMGGATKILSSATGTKTLGSVSTNTLGKTIGSGVSLNAGNIGVTVAGKTLNLPTLALVSGTSSGLNEAYQKEGVTHAQAWAKGLTSGAIEGVTEGMFGMFGVGGNELTDQMASNLAKKFSSSLGKQVANMTAKGGGEAFEELASYTLNWLTDNNVIDKMKGADFKSDFDWEDVSEQMALAFISSGVLQGSSTALQVNSQVNEIIDSKEQELGRKLTKEEKKAIRSETAQKIIDAENGLNETQTQVNEQEDIAPVQQQEVLNQAEQEDIAPVNMASVEQTNQPTTQEVKSNLATEVESNAYNIENNRNIWYNKNAEEGLYGNQQTNQNNTIKTAYENQNEYSRRTTNTENIEKNRINERTVRSTTSGIRINEYKTDNGNVITYGETSPSVSFKDTYNIVKESKNSNPYGAFVDLHEESEYSKMKNFTLSNGVGNVSVTEDGNIVSVVKNPNSNIKGASKQLLLTALKNGGNKLDNYDGFLTDNYIKAGFEPVARVKFDPEYAPDGWNFERDGQPDIIVMKHNGDSVEVVEKNYGKYDYDVDNLPYMDYDDAIAYRDKLIENDQNTQKNSAETLQSAERTTPTQQELDNLEDMRKNKSGSEYANAFYALEKKYGKANLYKGLNNYKLTGQALEDIAPIKAELTDLTDNLKTTIKDTKKELKALKTELNNVKESVNDVVEEYKAMTEADLPGFEKQNRESLQTITDEDIAPIRENTTPEIEENTTEVKSPLDDRTIEEVGSKKVNAYQYDNPEVRPYFQEMAQYMLNDLNGSQKGQRMVIGDISQTGSGNYEFAGQSRVTTSDIAELLDSKYNYSYDDIRKGLEAIIKDHGAENIAVAKRIEFALDERLRNGYTDVDGYDIPANQEYINLLKAKEFNDYYSSIPITEPSVNELEQANLNEIAPVKTNTLTNESVAKNNSKKLYEAIEPAPVKKSSGEKMIRVKPEMDIAPIKQLPDKTAFNKAVIESNKQIKNELGYIPKDPTRASSYELDDTSKETTTNQEIAKILDTEPKTENQRNKRKWAIAKANLFDKGAVFEDVSLKNKNRDLMGKWDYTLTSEARGQNAIGQGHYEYDPISKSTKQVSKSLNDIRAEVEKTGLTQQFYEYIYHKHNVDRMNLSQRYEGMKNKPVFGDSVTSDVSQEIVNQYEFSNPEFMDYAQDVYDYLNADRQELVKNGVISQETADLWSEMYPHYVPVRRVNDTGLDINVPLDTGRTGVNAPIKKATGGSSDILPLFDTMAQRTLQTYRATAKNSFGVELKNTLGTTIETQQTNIDEVIDSIDAQEGLLQEGKNGSNPTFTVFENGEKTTFEITQDMYDALKPLSDSSILSKTIKPLNVASNFHRGVLTEYNPVFMLTNAIKDAQDVLINSQHATKTYSKIPEAFKQLKQKGYWYQEYIANGGEQNSYFDSQENTFNAERKGISKILDLPPLSTISKLNNFIEMTPRLAEYIASREAGRSIEVSMLDSARVTTNFKAGGNLTKFLNRNGATFLNASVQGAMQQVRNIREAKANGLKGWVNLATKFAVAGLPAVLLNGLIWDDDDDYEELSDYVKQNYYVVWKNDDGQFVRIPKGRTVAVIQNAIEQVSKASSGDDEADLKEFLNLALTNLAPNNPIENNILSPVIQVANNKTWYGEDLVPTRLQDLPSKEQFDESTDSFSKWLGDKLNISPMKINYLLDQYTGGVGDVVLPMMTPEAESGDDSLGGNLLAPLKKKFTTNATMNNQNISDFYDTSDKLSTEAKKKDATDEDKIKYKYLNTISSEMSKLYTKKREIQNDTSLSKSEKYNKVKEIQSQINELSKEGLNQYEKGTYKENYASIGGQDFYKKINSDGEEEWSKVKDEEAEDLKELNLSNDEKNTYFKAKLDISDITKAYKEDKEDLTGDEESKTYKNAVKELSNEKKKSIIDTILDSSLSDEGKEYMYSKYYTGEKTLGKITDTGTSMDTYLTFVKDTMDFEADLDDDGKKISGSLNNKYEKYLLDSNLSDNDKTTLYEYGVLSGYDDEDKYKKYKVMKSAGVDINSWLDFDSQVFEADYKSNGKAISGSKKNKVISYINSLDLSIPQKAMMIRTQYSSFDNYNNDIVNYVIDLDLDYEEKVFMIETLGMKVLADGTVTWK